MSIATRTATLEESALPVGDEERFAGWGIMALTFRSGHVLALRRWPASSIGPAYTSVWHRFPNGVWRMWQDAPDEVSCPRYFSSAVSEQTRCPVELQWRDDTTLHVEVPGIVDWTMQVHATPSTRMMNAMASLLPQAAWRSPLLLRVMSRIAGPFLRLGRLALTGRVPNGHRYRMGPSRVWMVPEATATVDGTDLGPIGPLEQQDQLGDFWIPQRGVLAHGRAWLDREA